MGNPAPAGFFFGRDIADELATDTKKPPVCTGGFFMTMH
jgi:hypothetical protein